MPKTFPNDVADPSGQQEQDRGDQRVDDQWCKHELFLYIKA